MSNLTNTQLPVGTGQPQDLYFFKQPNNSPPQPQPVERVPEQPSPLTFNKEAFANLSITDQQLFEQFGKGVTAPLPYTRIHKAFEAQAKANPHAIAAYHLDEAITYRMLDMQANRLATHLTHLGVRTGDHVALFLERSIPMLVGMMAILKTGAAYVPQDVRISPASKLEHIIKVAETAVVLTTRKFQAEMPIADHVSCVAIDAFMQEPLEADHAVPFTPITPIRRDNTCYVLFTSGTTGKPNGVQVTHGNVCNILLTAPGNLGIRPGMRVGQILNIAFDMAAWEILACLGNGGTLVIRGKEFEPIIQNVDVLIATPTVLGSFDADLCHNVKVTAVAGEPCPKPLADKWGAFCTFYNSCGPTEVTIINTMQAYDPADGHLTIGAPTPNNTVYVLNEQMEPCAIGEIGEMWAGGDCVSTGYLHNDQLNKERYAPDPFLGGGRMMFRTRDLGRWTANGELEHFGRTDDQVKIRGFRVELDSVSNVLESTPNCDKAVTLKFDDRYLVAFVTPQTVDPELAEQKVAKHLPYYCVPKKIFPMASVPMTGRGKVDKRALLKMAQEAIAQEALEVVSC